MTKNVMSGSCRCGAEVRRDISHLDGWLRERMEAMPVVCDQCIAEAGQRDREQELFRERQARARRGAARVQHSAIPAALLGIGFDGVDPTHDRAAAIDAARVWAIGEIPGVTLTGPVGTGKTRIAAAAANLMLEHRPLRWTSAPMLFARLGQEFGGTAREQAIEMLIGGHALVIDDLDKARPTEFGAEHVFAAIDSRLTEGVPLLVTTNLSSDELRAKWPEPYGDAIISRLGGYTRGVLVGGHDRRLGGQHGDR